LLKLACCRFYLVKRKEAQAYKREYLDCFPLGNYGHPKGDNQGQSPCMQEGLKSKILKSSMRLLAAHRLLKSKIFNALDYFPLETTQAVKIQYFKNA